MARLTAAPSRPRLLLAALLAAGLASPLAPLGCADKDPSGIVLVLDSQSPALPEPSREIDHIQIDWEYNNNADTVFGGSILVAQGDTNEEAQLKDFPGTLTFQADPDTDSPTDQTLSLKIIAFTSTRSGQAPYTITRRVKATFADQKLLALPVTLEMACLAPAGQATESKDDFGCDQFSTCIGGKCRTLQTLGETDLQPFNEDEFFASTGPAQCLDVSSDSGCFAGASRVPVSGIRYELKDNSSATCDFDIATDDPEGLKRNLNVAVVWAEGNGRATVLDFIDSPEPSTAGWTATAQLNQVLKVSLPDGVCENLRRGSEGRVTDVLYAQKSTCNAKPPQQRVCTGSVDELRADKSTCEPNSNVIDSRPGTCSTCLKQQGQSSPPVAACAQDAGCQAILACRRTCKGATKAACEQACDETPTCPGSAARALAALAAIESNGLCPNVCK